MTERSLNESYEDTPEIRTWFLDELYRMEDNVLKHDEAAAAANLPELKIDHPPTLLVACNGKVGLVRPSECHPAAFIIAQLARGIVEVFNCQLSKTKPIR